MDDLKYIVNILSLTSVEQNEHLKRLGTFPSTDELALEFEDAYFYFKSRLERETIDIDKDIILSIEKINNMLDGLSYSNDMDIWNVNSLNGKEWSNIRQVAASVMEQFLDSE